MELKAFCWLSKQDRPRSIDMEPTALCWLKELMRQRSIDMELKAFVPVKRTNEVEVYRRRTDGIVSINME